jgi:pimeloyl-ACP methyl ester carboxylesterase
MRSGDWVLLLHGGTAGQSPWAESSRSWAETGAALEAQGYRVIAVDRPGHGGNAATSLDDLGYDRDVETAARAIADHEGSAHVVAHAESGITALLLARRSAQEKYGITVRSVSIVGGYGAEPTADGPNRVVLDYPPRERWSPASQRWAIRRLTYSGDAFDDRFDDRVSAKTAREAAELVAAVGAQAQLNGDLLRAKNAIFAHARDHGYDVPISLTFGMSDPLCESPRAFELMKLLASTTAHLELNLVDRAGHFVHRERPAEFQRLLTGFLAKASV